MAFLVPDRMFESIFEITPEFLKDAGIRGILCDIDNTLVTYDDEVPTEAVLKWLGVLCDNGIKVALISNNNETRVSLFNSALGLPAYANAAKPLTKSAKQALKALGTKKSETATLGDQIFTDVWLGRLLGVRTIVVPPIKDKTGLFFRFKRFLEKPAIFVYGKKHPKKKTNND